MRCAIIGLGMAVAPHAKSLLDLRGRVEVAAAFSRTAARREEFAAAYGLPVSDDLDGIIADPSIDYVVLLTPPNARLELVQRLAAAGKHILMEKPVERTTAAAEAVVAAAANVTFGIVFQFRFRDLSERLAELVREGALGELAAANIVVPWWRPQSYYDVPGRGSYARDGGGVLISQAIHTMDLAFSLTGPAVEVSAVAGTSKIHKMESEDYVAAGLRFGNGVMGSLMATTAFYPGGADRIELLGTRASASLSATDLIVRSHDGGEETTTAQQGGGGGADPMDFPHDAHLALHTDFLDAVEQGRPPRITGEGALVVHRFIDAVVESSKTKAAVQLT